MAKKIQINKNRSGQAEEDASLYNDTLELPDDFGRPPSPGIIKADDGSLQVKNIRISSIGLDFVGDVTEEEYEIFGQTLLQIDTAYQWIVGDYLVYGTEKKYGKATEFAELLGKSPQTVWNWASVAKSIETSRRREVLSFGHHEVITGLSVEEQDYWLSQAEFGNGEDGKAHKVWSVKRLRTEIARSQGDEPTTEAPMTPYQRIANRFDDSLARLVAQHKKAKTQEDKNNIRQVLTSLITQAETALNEIDDE